MPPKIRLQDLVQVEELEGVVLGARTPHLAQELQAAERLGGSALPPAQGRSVVVVSP